MCFPGGPARVQPLSADNVQERTIARVRSTLGNTIELRPVADEDTPRSRMGEQVRVGAAQLLLPSAGRFVR